MSMLKCHSIPLHEIRSISESKLIALSIPPGKIQNTYSRWNALIV